MVGPTMRRFRGGLLLGLFLSACQNVAGPPSSAVPYAPPPMYAAWWQLMERCSGREGEFHSIHWFVAPNATFDLEGETVQGAYYPAGNRIVIANGQTRDGRLVRHEMLHALLKKAGHPRDEFLGRCGDIVVCVAACLTDAGGPLDTSTTAPLADAASMTVETVVTPNEAYLSRYDGWFTVMVTVTNASPRRVRASMPASDQSVRFWFTGIGDGEGRNLDAPLALAPAGAAGSTRRFVFTVQPTGPEYGGLVPGSYTVQGVFAGKSAATVPFSLDW